MRITRHEEFEVAHLLDGYKGGCGNLHGHTYKIDVTIEGPQDNDQWGFVIDFKQLKSAIREALPDHKFIADANAVEGDGPERMIVEVLDKFGMDYELYPFPTSAENMVYLYAKKIQANLSKLVPPVSDSVPGQLSGLTVVEVKLWETTNSYATWISEV